jgi:hypothetical protein
MNKHITDSILINDVNEIKEIQSNSLTVEPKEENNITVKSLEDNSNLFSKINKKVSVIYMDRLTGGKDDITGILKFDEKKGAFYVEVLDEESIVNIYLFTLKNYKINLINE